MPQDLTFRQFLEQITNTQFNPVLIRAGSLLTRLPSSYRLCITDALNKAQDIFNAEKRSHTPTLPKFRHESLSTALNRRQLATQIF
jgi:hypothetical protein